MYLVVPDSNRAKWIIVRSAQLAVSLSLAAQFVGPASVVSTSMLRPTPKASVVDLAKLSSAHGPVMPS